jgi:hypothetical protein
LLADRTILVVLGEAVESTLAVKRGIDWEGAMDELAGAGIDD